MQSCAMTIDIFKLEKKMGVYIVHGACDRAVEQWWKCATFRLIKGGET